MDIFDSRKNINPDVYKKPIDASIIKKDHAGNRYVSAYDTVKIADDAFKEQWSLDVKTLWSEKIADYDIVFFASVTVTVPGFGCRSAIGGASFRDILLTSGRGKLVSELSVKDVQATRSSDLYKMAVTDGMKKALSLFQICAEVYTAEADKMETGGGERQAYGAPTLAKKPPSRIAELSEENKVKARELMDAHGLKKTSQLNTALEAANIGTLDNESLEKFKTYLEGMAGKKEEKKDIPV